MRNSHMMINTLQLLSFLPIIQGFVIHPTTTTTIQQYSVTTARSSSSANSRTNLNSLPSPLSSLENVITSNSYTIADAIESTTTATATTSASTTAASTAASTYIPPDNIGLSGTTNTIVFIIGIIPFLWATYEFWSRIAVGASFGTGKDSIQIKKPSSDAIMKELTTTRTIGKDGDLNKSRGQQVLGDDALFVAYFLFAVAIGSVGIAIYSVLSSPLPSTM